MRRWIPIGLIVFVMILHPSPASGQEGGRYYPETGHTLDGRFVSYFDSHGGVEILGFPITDVFVDPEQGYPVQYLENARLEWVRQGDAYGVRMPVLGELLGGWDAPLSGSSAAIGSSSGCRYFHESGHRICFAFLDFFNQHGGAEIFGYPISEFKIESGRVVQYFQSFRLDWHPEAPGEIQVQVAPLGLQHFETMGYAPNLLRSHPPEDMGEYRLIELRSQVSLTKPVVQSDDWQLVFVVVRDQNLMPVQNASVTLEVQFADQEHVLVLPQSDAAGISSTRLEFEDQPPGSSVRLEVLVAKDGLETITRDSFLIWW